MHKDCDGDRDKIFTGRVVEPMLKLFIVDVPILTPPKFMKSDCLISTQNWNCIYSIWIFNMTI